MVLLDTGSVDAAGEAAVWWVDQLGFEALGEGDEIAEPAAVYPSFGDYVLDHFDEWTEAGNP